MIDTYHLPGSTCIFFFNCITVMVYFVGNWYWYTKEYIFGITIIVLYKGNHKINFKSL
jgi:hypothetical protein